MPAGSKIITRLTDDAVRWVESLSRKLSEAPKTRWSEPTDPEYVAEQAGERLVNLSEQAPQMLDIYNDKALYQILQEAEAGESSLGLVSPETFRRAAAEIPMDDPYIRQLVGEKVQALSDLIESGIPLSDVPFLSVDNPIDRVAQTVGHEGRHRSRAFEALGEPDQLVRFIHRSWKQPVSDLPRDTQLYSEISGMQREGGGKSIGTLGELIKFLSIAPPVAAGALSQLPEEAEVE